MDLGERFAQVFSAAGLAFLAWLGILARHAHAGALAGGKVNWRALAVDSLTAPFLGLCGGAALQKIGAPDYATWALVALCGYLGPAFVKATAEAVRDIWIKRAGGAGGGGQQP